MSRTGPTSSSTSWMRCVPTHWACMAPERVAPPRSTRSCGAGLHARLCRRASWTKPIRHYPPHLAVSGNAPARCAIFYSDALPQSVLTLQDALAAGGYLTAQFSANPFTGTLSNLDQGLTLQRHRRVFAERGRHRRRPGDSGQTDSPARHGLDHPSQGRPVLCLHPRPRHSPTVQRNRLDRAEAYDASLASVDAEIGRLREQVAALGLGRQRAVHFDR